MKKHIRNAIFGTIFSSLLLCAVETLIAKEPLKVGDYVAKQDAYYAGKVDKPFKGLYAKPSVTPTDSYYNTQKSYSMRILGDIESTWNAYTGKGTKIAVIDDGFAYNHPEYYRADGSSIILDESRYYHSDDTYIYYEEYSDDHSVIDESWNVKTGKYDTHGTATSTTACAPMGNGGTVGIAPEASLLALKIDMSFAAIYYAIDYAISQHVDVINMSLGAYAETFYDGFGEQQSGSSAVAEILEDICQEAYEAGIIVVAAAGNEATWHKSYPACNYKVIGVGALEEDAATTLAAFTNYVDSNQTGEINVDILSPGYVYTAEVSGSNKSNPYSHIWHDTQGTSFSSPIVAGAACLWKQKYPNGTPDQFLSQLQSTADGIGTYTNKYVPVNYYQGYDSPVGPSNITNGRLNVGNLLAIDDPFVALNDDRVSVTKGQTVASPIDLYNGSLSYSSSNTSIATVNNNGVITGVGVGSATITVTATKNAKTDQKTFIVDVYDNVAVTDFTLAATSATISVGGTYQIEVASVTPENAIPTFIYASRNENIATVDDNGLITGVAIGTTVIDLLEDSGLEAEFTITVESAPIPPEPDVYYERINNVQDLDEGEYLIVCESNDVAFQSSLETLDVANNYIDVTIDNATIESSNTVDANTVTITKSGEDYTIRAANNKYIGAADNSNMLTMSNSPLANTISFSGNDVRIIGTGGPTIKYNAANDQHRFRYYKSGQTAVQLYKQIDNNRPDKVLDSITAVYNGSDIYVGGSLDTSKITVTAHYTEPSYYKDALVNGWTSSGFSSATAGNKTVTISYTEAAVTKTTTVNVNVIEDTVTSISASNTKVYLPGESIAKSDFTVTAIYSSGKQENVQTANFNITNDGYMFTYGDAPSGGTNGSKQVTVSAYGYNQNLNLTVKRTAYSLPTYSDTVLHPSDFVGKVGTSNSDTTTGEITVGGIAYDVKNAYIYNNTYLSFGRVKDGGHIFNVTPLSKPLLRVLITDSSSISPTTLKYSEDGDTWINYDADTLSNGNYRYFKIAYSGSNNSYTNLTSLTYRFKGDETLNNVVNYINYEDTTNQCVTKLDYALNKLNLLSNDDKQAFMNSSDYKVSFARERLFAWARHEGKEISLSNNTFVSSSFNATTNSKVYNTNASLVLLVVISLVGITSIGIVCYRRKEN